MSWVETDHGVQVVRDALAEMPEAEPIHVRIEKLWFSTTTIRGI